MLRVQALTQRSTTDHSDQLRHGMCRRGRPEHRVGQASRADSIVGGAVPGRGRALRVTEEICHCSTGSDRPPRYAVCGQCPPPAQGGSHRRRPRVSDGDRQWGSHTMIGIDQRTHDSPPMAAPTNPSRDTSALARGARVMVLRTCHRRDGAPGQPEPRPPAPSAAADPADPVLPVSA